MSGNENAQTIIGANCRINGDMTLEGDCTILGQFDGTLRTSGVVELTDSSSISGTVIAGAARLGGNADADIVAEHGVELLAGSELTGRLFTTRLSIVDGASFAGEVAVGPKAMASAQDVIQEIGANQHSETRTRTPGRVEVATSLDNILKQHRARSKKAAETAPDNGA